MSVIRVNPIGRFGNQLFQYSHARAYAEKFGCELQVPTWIGEKIFDLNDSGPDDQKLPTYSEFDVPPAAVDLEFRTYAQSPQAMIYTQDEAKRYFKFRPEILKILESVTIPQVAAHRRIGDYIPLGYPVVSEKSYFKECERLQVGIPVMVTEENPYIVDGIPDELSFLPDFWRLMNASIMLRANSSFSWWAGTLGSCQVYAPRIDGLEGGKEHDCEFACGNFPRLANLPGIEEVQVKPGFREEMRYEYNLNSESYVIDIGAYHGEFAAEMSTRYHCTVDAYEPIQEFRSVAFGLLAKHTKVTLHPCGVGASHGELVFGVKGNMTGRYEQGNFQESVQILSIDTVMAQRDPDVLKLNVEGMEFEILEAMLERNLITKCRNIQVQFHGNGGGFDRWRKLRANLCKTHRLTFDYPWCWENYERK